MDNMARDIFERGGLTATGRMLTAVHSAHRDPASPDNSRRRLLMLRVTPAAAFRLFALLACIVVGSGLPVLAQGTLTWEDIAGSSGYDLLIPGSGDTLFGANSGGTLAMSPDGGLSWQNILSYPSYSPITAVVANGSHLLVAITDNDYPIGRYKIIQWDHQPNLWHAIWATHDPSYSNIAVDSSGLVFMFAQGDLDTYDGIRWKTRTTALPFETMLFVLNGVLIVHSTPYIDNHENLIVGVYQADNIIMNGLYISYDTGVTWHQPLSDFAVTAIDGSLSGKLVIGASPLGSVNTAGGIFVTTDSGATWRGLGLTNHVISTITHTSDGTLFAVADGGLYRYDTAQVSWTLVTDNSIPFSTIASLPAGVMVSGSSAAGQFRSTDGGVNWQGGKIRGKDVFSIALTDSGDIVGGTLGTGIFRSMGGGAQWLPSVTQTGSADCYALALNSADGSLYAGTEDGVLHSTDNGLTWNASGDSAIAGSAFSVGVLSTGSVLAGTGFGVFRSTDGGHHWRASGLSASKIFFMDVAPGDNILVGTATDGIFSSSDGGSTWKSLGVARDDIQSVLTTASGDYLAGVYGGVYRSTNQGASWSYNQFDSTYVYALMRTQSPTVYAGTADGIYSSTDDGQTWYPAGSSGIPDPVTLSFGLTTDGKLLAGIYRGGIFRTKAPLAGMRANGVGRESGIPAEFSLAQNYPNPFNPSTTIRYALPHRAAVDLTVFDVTGRIVATIAHGEQPAGEYLAQWDASRLASGVYFYRLRAGEYLGVRKMLLIR